MVALGHDGQARHLIPEFCDCAALTRYGGLFGNQNTENYLLSVEAERNGRPAPCFAVTRGNEKHTSTAVAGALVLSELDRALRSSGDEPAEQRLHEAFSAASRRIYEISEAKPRIHKWAFVSCFTGDVKDLGGLGATATAATLDGDALVLAHVGDCAAYLLRDDRLQRLTRDETLRGRAELHTELSHEQLEYHGDICTKCLGFEGAVESQVVRVDLLTGDTVILATLPLARVLDARKGAPIAGLDARDATRALADLVPLGDRGDLSATCVVVRRY
jgi:serine/threonine protein phosphatase PrpC